MLTVDQNSLDRVMADPHYQFKSLHFRFVPVAENGVTEPTVIARFRSMLTQDPAHMMPNEKGSAVVAIHGALVKIFQMPLSHSNFGFRDSNEQALRLYGSLTQRHITQLKAKHNILNYMKAIDPIIGKKTIRALDFILHSNGK